MLNIIYIILKYIILIESFLNLKIIYIYIILYYYLNLIKKYKNDKIWIRNCLINKILILC